MIRFDDALKERTIRRRRDFHHYPETAWTEYRTASIVAQTLTDLGYRLSVAEEVMDLDARMGVPPLKVLEQQAERALAQGALPRWVERMRGGRTGIVGLLDFGRPGPTVALRFDMDANDITEMEDDSHRPYREKFSSANAGAMHACGHDGHTSVGLALAEMLAGARESLAGRVKLIFQPAEEGGRGAKCMAVKGVVDDVDYMIGMHFGINVRKTGAVACKSEGFWESIKTDAVFTGLPAHAGAAPETGRNALLAAANAALNVHAISRHAGGPSRVNVGVLNAGTGRNVVAPNAVMKFETRGSRDTVIEYMQREAVRVIEGAAAMYGVKVSFTHMGQSINCDCDEELVQCARRSAERSGLFDEILPTVDFGGGEDATFFMKRVQAHGGKANFLTVGTRLVAGHHDYRFDLDEEALGRAAVLLAGMVEELLTPAGR